MFQTLRRLFAATRRDVQPRPSFLKLDTLEGRDCPAVLLAHTAHVPVVSQAVAPPLAPVSGSLDPQPLPPGNKAVSPMLNLSGWGDQVSLDPQPLPPGAKVTLDPQPLPPGSKVSLDPQPLPPGAKVSLDPQPLPPKVEAVRSKVVINILPSQAAVAPAPVVHTTIVMRGVWVG